MEPSTLASRIAECINDLGMLLDQIYKFPQRQRQHFFDQIQAIKNQLASLKINTRQCSISATQKRYKQLYLATNTLRNEIQHQSALLQVKENKENIRIKESRETKKNYQETIKLLVVKEDQLQTMRKILFEKEELINSNFQELNELKKQNEVLTDSNRIMKYQQNDYELQLERIKTLLSRTEQELMDIKIRQEEKDRAFNDSIDELERLKVELLQANQRIITLQYTNQLNTKKTKVAEQNSKKAQLTTQGLADHVLLKEYDNTQNLKIINQLEFQLKIKRESLQQEQQRNKHLREDIQVLENEVNKLEKKNSQLELQFQKDINIAKDEKALLKEQIEKCLIRQNELKKLLSESDRKHLNLISKINSAEEYKNQLIESQCQKEVLAEKIITLQNSIQSFQKQIGILIRQKEKIQSKFQNQQTLVRSLELELFRLKQKQKIREQQSAQVILSVEALKGKIKEYQRELLLKQKKQKQLEQRLLNQKQHVIKIQGTSKNYNQEIEKLKIKLIKAKIQTVHEIRQTLSSQ